MIYKNALTTVGWFNRIMRKLTLISNTVYFKHRRRDLLRSLGGPVLTVRGSLPPRRSQVGARDRPRVARNLSQDSPADARLRVVITPF